MLGPCFQPSITLTKCFFEFFSCDYHSYSTYSHFEEKHNSRLLKTFGTTFSTKEYPAMSQIFVYFLWQHKTLICLYQKLLDWVHVVFGHNKVGSCCSTDLLLNTDVVSGKKISFLQFVFFHRSFLTQCLRSQRSKSSMLAELSSMRGCVGHLVTTHHSLTVFMSVKLKKIDLKHKNPLYVKVIHIYHEWNGSRPL